MKGSEFIQYIRRWGVFFLVLFFVVIVILDSFYTFSGMRRQEHALRQEYVAQQKRIIKTEVSSVVNLIDYEYSSKARYTRELIKEQVASAYTLAENIYRTNRNTKSTTEIKAMINDALRPIRFSNGEGYFFITDLAGKEILYAGKPEREGTDMLNVRDSQGKYVVRDMIHIAKTQGEGFYAYRWMKPNSTGSDFNKLSFIKLFKPYGWIIGTGMYIDDISENLKKFIKSFVDTQRFGNEESGYAFIYRLYNIKGGSRFATMFANPNRPDLVGKYLSDTYKDADGKAFRKEMLKGLRENGEVFVRYRYKKLDSDKPAPKLSYFKLTADHSFIVGAGVYLDDVEKDITLLKKSLLKRTVEKLLIGIFIILGMVFFFFLLIQRFSRHLKKDISLFISFFNRAATSDEPIDVQEMRFDEFKKLAESANMMLYEKIEAVKSLVKSEKSYRELSRLKNEILESAQGIIVYALDTNYRYIDFTKLHREMMKKFKGADIEIGGNKLSYIHDKKERMGRKAYFDRALRGESFVFYEEYSDNPPLVTTFENRYSPIYGEDQTIIGLSAYVIDITELKRAQNELEENRERFEKLASLTFEGILIHRNGLVLDVNESLLKISGYSREELVGKNVVSMFVPEEYHEKIRKEIVKKIVKPYEVMGRKKDGSLIPIEIESRNIESKNEDFRVTAIRDITERKKIEEEHIKLSKLESLGVLAGGIAHDFNNILTGFFGNLELAQMELPAGHPSSPYLARARDAIERATRLTKQLLTFSRGGEPVFEEADLAAVARSIAEFTLSGSNIKVHFSIAEDLRRVRADKGQLEQVITNLVLNAKQAMPGGGSLFITLDNTTNTDGDFVRLRIEDEGEGIPPELMQKIFDPFFTTKATGNGLGLATVFSIIEKHGGHITVDSTAGKGSVFTVFLPPGRSLPVPEPVVPEPPRQDKKAYAGRILVMDDEEMICDIVSAMLESLGYRTETVSDGEEAVEKYAGAYAAGEGYDAVILDLTVPRGTGGLDAVKKILHVDSGARVLVSSGYSGGSILKNYREYGFSGILAKPFRLEELAGELERVLQL